MSDTGGKVVCEAGRVWAFQDGVVNIGSNLNATSTPSGQWPNSVIVGAQDELAADINFSSAVFVGDIEFRYSHGYDLAASVVVGLFGFYAGTSMAGGAAIGVAEISADYCVSVGAGNGASNFVRSHRSVCIGNNAFIQNDAPDTILLGSYASMGAYTEKNIALAFHADFQSELSYIGDYATHDILLGVGTIGGIGFVYHWSTYNFAVNAIIDDRIEYSTCVLGHIIDQDPDEIVLSNSIVFGQYSSSSSYSQVVLGVNSTIGSGSSFLSDGSFESVILGLNSAIGLNSEKSVVLSGGNSTLAQRSPGSISLGSFSSTGNDTQGAFNWHGFIGNSTYFAVSMLGHVGTGSDNAIAMGFTSYVGDGSVGCLSIGSNAHVWDLCSSIVAMGRSAVCGQSCRESVVIGNEAVVGGDIGGYGTYEAVCLGADVFVGDQSQYGIAIGFNLHAGLSGPQNVSNCVLVNLFGVSMAVGTDAITIDRINCFGGYTFVHSGNSAVHMFGFNQVSTASATYRSTMIGNWNGVLSPTESSILIGDHLQVGENSGSGVSFAIAIGNHCSIYDGGQNVAAIGHVVYAGLAGTQVAPNCTESVLIGHSLGVGLDGLGITRVVAIGSYHTEQHTDTDITAIGGDIGAYAGSQFVVLVGKDVNSEAGSNHAVIIGNRLYVGQAAPVSYAVLIGSDSTISDGAGSTVAVGFAMTIAANADHSIALGAGAKATGSVSLAMGEGATAATHQWVIGDTIAPIHEFIIRGATGGGGPLNTLRAIDNPVSGATGLFVVYNNGATLSNKQVMAQVLPLPVGSLLMYVDP